MKIVCISDTHTYHNQIKIPPGDVLIHAGDVSHDGSIEQVQDFLDWFSRLPHKDKIFIAGNHDRILQDDPEWTRAMVPDGVTYLQDSGVEVEGLYFYGSPWTPRYGRHRAFAKERGTLRDKWSLIPDQTSVLITHGPPMGILDITLRPPCEHVGCPELSQRVRQVQPKLHVCGHVHEGWGIKKHGHTHFVNAGIWNHRAGGLLQDPIVINI